MTVKLTNELINFIRPSEHSKYSPSSIDRVISCPFSVKASEGIPNISSKYAAEGTLAHSVCEALYRQHMYDIEFPADLSMQLVSLDDGGQEMMDAAHVYVDVVKSWLSNFNDKIGKVLWYGLEKGVPIYPKLECFGTADCLIVGTKGAAIIDFKYGKGKAVSGDSVQLRTYAAGVHRHLEDVPFDYKYYSVIVQPRIYVSPKEWEYSVAEMDEHLAVILKAIDTSNSSATLTPCEGSWCYFCPANKTVDPYKKCPAIKQKALVAAQEDFGKFLADMNSPVSTVEQHNRERDQALIKIISIAPILNKIAEDGMAEFQYRIENGERIENIQVVESVGRRKWKHNDEKEMEKEIRSSYPQVGELVKTVTKLKSITDVEKMLGKGSMDGLTVKAVTKKLKVVDAEAQRVLGELADYANRETDLI